MPLITCPDCRRPISDAAPVCPGCGRPTSTGPASARRVQTIEATGKIWKLLQLIGGGGLCWVVASAIMEYNNRLPATGEKIGGLVLGGLASFMLYLTARMGAWWFHH